MLAPWMLKLNSKKHAQTKLTFLLRSVLSSCSLFLHLMTTPSYFPQAQNLRVLLASPTLLILHIWFVSLLTICCQSYLWITLFSNIHPFAAFTCLLHHSKFSLFLCRSNHTTYDSCLLRREGKKKTISTVPRGQTLNSALILRLSTDLDLTYLSN